MKWFATGEMPEIFLKWIENEEISIDFYKNNKQNVCRKIKEKIPAKKDMQVKEWSEGNGNLQSGIPEGRRVY